MQQRDLNVAQGSANCSGSIGDHFQLDGRRDRRLKLGKQAEHVVDRLNYVGARLAENYENYSGLPLERP